MAAEFEFGPFRLESANARLLRGHEPVALKPKAFDVLSYLVQRAGRLVSQEELLRAIWPDTIVGDSSLKSCIRQIRSALGDRVREPLFIETVHRRGYRFIAKVASAVEAVPAGASEPGFVRHSNDSSVLVGREPELRQLHAWLGSARSGQRQVVFITGGPGSGKTALAEGFVQQAGSNSQIMFAVGQCFEQFGSGEAYLPVFEALGRLGRGHAKERLLEVLSSHAPTWLAHLPGLDRQSVESPAVIPTAPPERMLREMAEALGRLTATTPLVLVLEDLHWADYSTLDLISALARRREPSQLLLLATYRPVDAVLSGHPLRAVKQDLLARGQCHELPVGLLSDTAVADYLEARFPGDGLPKGLAKLLHERTEGHPLFLVNLVDDWLSQGVLAQSAGKTQTGWELKTDLDALSDGVPASIRALIEKQVERLGADELRIIESASIAGIEFSVAAAAVAAEMDVGKAEVSCEALCRRHHFLQPKGAAEWPDGTVSARYRFGHELYHRVVSENVSTSRRRALHLRIGERLESAYGERSSEAAAELALHFENAGDAVRAVKYCEFAAGRASRNYAYREAIDYLRRALAVVARLSESDRIAAELRLLVNLGLQLQITQGFAAPSANRAYLRARELCRELGASRQLFPVLWGLWLFHKGRSELPKARTMADELLALAQQLDDSALALQAHQALAVTTLCMGEPTATVEHMHRGAALYDPQRHDAHNILFGQDPGVACRAFGGVALWLLGYPEQALRASREAAQRSHELVQPSSQALALYFAAMVHQCRRDGAAARACADLALTIAEDQGFSFWRAGGAVLRGWAIAECGDVRDGIAILREGLESFHATGSVTYRTYFLSLLAELLAREGQASPALTVVDEALTLIGQTSERLYEAELHRIRGVLLNASGDTVAAEACLREAIRVAREQNAKALELRAVMSLVRLNRKHSPMLAEILGWFTEGFDTPDLQEAKELFAELA